ncbi:DNA polymerase Y family protein [Amycolatopsis sp. NBC_01480]|uniref:DNA polymerase Y family protein n=1 Tax=Amycolatopsis sp. NBC_01480 TaxID=2903562 RepID=UPI002E294704|nr:DNA polymerase Y family protein [Amycolatopsis sp. NBC_01480]
MSAVRLMVVYCPDWPVVAATAAAGIPVTRPAAVYSGNRVVACSAAARACGVRRGMARRAAESLCEYVARFDQDADRDARLFEPVAAAVERLAVGVEVVRPGVVAVPVAGAAGYFGGEEQLGERVVDEVAARAGVECEVGVADGLFAATLAARTGQLVAPGASAQFLAPRAIGDLDQPEAPRATLVASLRQLGLRTLGAFAELAERDVAGRFGADGAQAHRLARGLSERPPARRRPPPELAVQESFDPPLERVDAAAFVAKALGERLHGVLAARGLACTRLAVRAVTEADEQFARVWRCAEPLTAQGIADRARWQCDSWLTRPPSGRPTAGMVRLVLEPEETVAGAALQLQLTGRAEHADADERAGRAFTRVQALLGPDAVVTAQLVGGRGPSDRVRFVPWGEPRDADDAAPWPGRLPAPAPAIVPHSKTPVVVRDVDGHEVVPTERQGLTGVPAVAEVEGRPPSPVLGWAGPWRAQTADWRPGNTGDQTRIQLLLGETQPGRGDTAVLLLHGELSGPQWILEGVYR